MPKWMLTFRTSSYARTLPIVAAVILFLALLIFLSSVAVDSAAWAAGMSIQDTVLGAVSGELVARVTVVGLCIWKIARIVSSADEVKDYRTLFSDRAFLLLLALLCFMTAQLDTRLHWFTRILAGEVDAVTNIQRAHRAVFMTFCTNSVGVLLLNYRTWSGGFAGFMLMLAASLTGAAIAVSVH
jgi:hypothetical protein